MFDNFINKIKHSENWTFIHDWFYLFLYHRAIFSWDIKFFNFSSFHI